MHGETAFDDADLHGFVDGRMEPSRAAALAAALGSDPEVSARIDAWQRQTDSLRSMFASVLCEPVPVRLLPLAVSPRGAPAKHPVPGAAPTRRLAGVVATTAAGAALAGFVLGVLASVGTDGFGLAPSAARDADTAMTKGVEGAEARDLAARAAEAHRTFLADPSRLAEIVDGDPQKTARAIGHRLRAGLRIPDLTRQGWTFMGGRIVPGRRGAAAFLAYRDGADRLGILVARGGAGDGQTAVRAVAADDGARPLGVATWADAAFDYALTADRGREWLARNIAPVRDAVKAQAHAADNDAPAP